jgi:hypothetical protein
MMIAIATFMAVAAASANNHEWRTIQGKFAATGISQCTMALFGFETDLSPKPKPGDNSQGWWSYGTGSWDAVFTFYKNGTGTVTGLNRVNELPGPAMGGIPYSHVPSLSWKFTYVATDEGRITFTLVPGTYKVEDINGIMYLDAVPRDGAISQDGQTINIFCGPPELLNVIGAPTQLSCAASLVLIRQSTTAHERE